MNNAHTKKFTTSTFFCNSSYLLSLCLPFLLLGSRTTADLVLVLVDLLFLAKCLHYKDWNWLKASWVKYGLVFFIYLILVNVPLSIQPLESLIYALFFLRWPLFAIAISEWLAKSKKFFRNCLISFLIAISFIIFDTWYQYLIGYDFFGFSIYPNQRLTGPFNKPIVGIMLVRVLFLGVFSVLVFDFLKKPTKNLVFTMTFLSIGLLTIFISGERMAFILGFSGFICVLLGYWLQYRHLRLKLLLFFLIFVFLIALACVLNPSVTERMIHNLVNKLLHFVNSDYGIVLNAAWRAFQENFLFGSGLHTYKYSCESLKLLVNTGFDCTHAHNLYLQIGAETGIIGLILFSVMIICIYIYALKHSINQANWLNTGLVFAILSLSFWPFIVGISLLNNWVASLAWFGVGWSISIMKMRRY